MPPLRLRLPAATATTSNILLRQSTAPVRSFTTSRVSAAASHAAEDGHDHGHESHYDPPSGWLWGLPPGEKYEKEGWEGLMYYGFLGSLILAGVAYAFKPDTSIQTWALEEARRRLEKEGLLEDSESSK